MAKGKKFKSHALTLTLVRPCLCRTRPKYSYIICYFKFHDPRSIHSRIIVFAAFAGRKTDTQTHTDMQEHSIA